MLLILSQIATAPATGGNAVDFTWLFIKMLLVLGIVTVGAVLILKYAAPKIGFMRRFQHGKHFRVLGRHALEPGKSLYLVHTAGRYLVLGVAENAISLITELAEKDVLKTDDE